jgi:ATP-binding cassette subfamily F protein 3
LAGQRIGILGANGQGKSTLIKTICGQIEPLAGRVIGARGLRIGYFAQQEMDLLQDEQTALQSLTRWAREKGPPAREQELRDFLGKFRFAGELAQQPVGTLSGGERARLVLAMIVWQGPNLLVLDEPTNHLDLQTREALSLALNGFEGTVLLVSHDRALLREVCDEFWLVSGARLQPFDGDLEDYQRWLAQAQGAGGDRLVPPDPSAVPPATSLGAIAAPVNRRDQRRAAATQRQQQAVSTRPLRQEQQQAEARLAEIAEERQGLEAHMARNSGPASGPEIVRAARALHALQQETEALELRWLEIAEALQSLESGPSSG